MVELNLTAKYFLYNQALGGDVVLGSTTSNDSLLILPLSYDTNKLWQFSWITETSASGYLYLNTIEKGTGRVLTVYSDNGNTNNPILDYRFGPRRGATGQFWMLQDQADGTVRLGNYYVGRKSWLDVVKDTSPPQITFTNSPGIKWTVSQATATPRPSSTSSSSPSSTFSLSSSMTPTPSSSSTFRTSSISIASTLAANTSTARVPPSVPGVQKHGVSAGAIAGIVIGVLVGVAILAFAAIWLLRRRRSRYEESPAIPSMTTNRPVLHTAD